MQYKPVENCHMENAVFKKDFNLGTTSSFFDAFTQLQVRNMPMSSLIQFQQNRLSLILSMPWVIHVLELLLVL
jgi:hypothetical protein